MMSLRELPFLRLLVPFLLGIALGPLPLDGGWSGWYFGMLVVLLLPMGIVLRVGWSFRHRHWPGLAVALFLFGWGLLWPALFREDASPLFVGRQGDNERPLKAVGIARLPEDRGRYRRLVLDLRALAPAGGKVEPAVGRLLVYLPREGPGVSFPDAGDTLLLWGRLGRLPGPANPEAFDFRAVQARRGIFYQVFVDRGDWQVRPRQVLAGRGRIAAVIFGARERVLAVLRRHLPGADEQAIAAALLIGNREGISPDLKQAYAASGAVHVLAVSGLHVGIVYLILGFLLGRLPLAGPWWRRVRGVLLLCGVWSFVLLAGAPPSAVRAGCMFSLFTVGHSLYRTSNVYNTIAAAAFVTLCLHPLLLQEVGFQLSYTAVAGIVTFQPWLYRLWHCPWRAVDYLWKLLTVAIAAQLGTFPLSLYYFHQFPLFFWLSGWVAVPAAALILSGGIGLLILDPVPVVGAVAGKALALIVGSLNVAIRWIETLPGALIEGWWLDPADVWVCYGWVLVLAGLIRRPVVRHWQWLLAMTALGLALRAGRHWQWHRQQQLVVYQVRGNTLIDLITGRQVYTLAGQGLSSTEEEWAARNYRWSRGSPANSPLATGTVAGKGTILRAGSLIWFAGRLICILDGNGKMPRPPPVIDYLVVCNDPPIEWWTSAGVGKVGMVIIDASNRRSSVRAWRQAAGRQKTPAWNIREHGALVISW